jgi:mannosyltransferase OCH1-like enzyme
MSCHDFPRQIWQIWISPLEGPSLAEIQANNEHMVSTWTSSNPDWAYRMIDSAFAHNLFTEHLNEHPQIREVFDSANLAISRADLLRLLVLYVHGGLYNDLDVECMRPIERWGLGYLDPEVELVVGIEYDNHDNVARAG